MVADDVGFSRRDSTAWRDNKPLFANSWRATLALNRRLCWARTTGWESVRPMAIAGGPRDRAAPRGPGNTSASRLRRRTYAPYPGRRGNQSTNSRGHGRGSLGCRAFVQDAHQVEGHHLLVGEAQVRGGKALDMNPKTLVKVFADEQIEGDKLSLPVHVS